MPAPIHLTRPQLDAGLDHIRQSPTDGGALVHIVRRPAVGRREVLESATLNFEEGLVGDTWVVRGSHRTRDGSRHPDMQLNVMNARAAALIAQTPERWGLAGDQLYVDLDLSETNLPAGTRLRIGSAVIEVTAEPHTGCGKFVQRFGVDAQKFVNGPVGRSLRLRGLNARVVTEGTVTTGDSVTKVPR